MHVEQLLEQHRPPIGVKVLPACWQTGRLGFNPWSIHTRDSKNGT